MFEASCPPWQWQLIHYVLFLRKSWGEAYRTHGALLRVFQKHLGWVILPNFLASEPVFLQTCIFKAPSSFDSETVLVHQAEGSLCSTLSLSVSTTQKKVIFKRVICCMVTIIHFMAQVPSILQVLLLGSILPNLSKHSVDRFPPPQLPLVTVLSS